MGYMEDQTNTSVLDELFDYNEDQTCLQEDLSKMSVVAVVLLIIVVFLSFFSNILLIVHFVCDSHSSGSRLVRKIITVHMCLSNLMFTLGLPFWISFHLWGWTFSIIVCRAVNFAFYAGLYNNILFLLLQTVAVFIVVVIVFFKQKIYLYHVICIIIWVVSCSLALTAVLHSTIVHDPEDEEKVYCEYDHMEWKHNNIYIQNTIFWAAFSFMLICYTILICKRLSHIGGEKVGGRLFIIPILNVTMFFFSWAPYMIAMILGVLRDRHVDPFTDCDVSKHHERVFYASRLLALSSCCFNSMLVICTDGRVRGHLISMCTRDCRRRTASKRAKEMRFMYSRRNQYQQQVPYSDQNRIPRNSYHYRSETPTEPETHKDVPTKSNPNQVTASEDGSSDRIQNDHNKS